MFKNKFYNVSYIYKIKKMLKIYFKVNHNHCHKTFQKHQLI